MNKKVLMITAAVLFPLSAAYADITVTGDNIEISKNCIKLESENVTVKTDDCRSDKFDKDKHENRSVHGDNNPGKGHDKGKPKKDK